MPIRYKELSKALVYHMVRKFPEQSSGVKKAVIKKIHHWNGPWDFNMFMNSLFFSKDILLRTGYYHLNVQLKKHITT
jgi:hypothetical protein